LAKKATHNYDESKIKTLSSLEHIRLRTGMYIGRVGDGASYDDGLYILLKEVLDNSIDEHIMGHGNEIQLAIADTAVSVRDFGRGIPLGKIVDCVSRINTGAKYNDEVFQFSVGLNGVGTKAVNALSSHFTVRSFRDGKFAEAHFERGKLTKEKQGKAPDEPNGTYISFVPDTEIFKKATFRQEILDRRMNHYAYLNSGLKIICNGNQYHSKNGLLDLLVDETNGESIYKPLHYKDKMLEISLTHSNRMNETHFSFVNGQFTSDGGTHLSAFREGILKAVNEFSKKKYDGDDVREGLIGAIAIRLKDPVFESQTKTKLGNTEIRSEIVSTVKDTVVDLLHRHPKQAEKMLAKIEENVELRKNLQTVKKMARDKAKATSIRVPQLKDCKVHYTKDKNKGEESMIFITEGQSASGSIVSCRDVTTQAIFTLKGKPLNVWDLKRDAIYKNDEMYNLMRSLNIEETVESLRYNKVILATDADVDGLHIRNLLITFFLRFFDQVISDGHLFILETPLFRVRNKKETHYCYDEDERQAAIKKLKSSAEITRFKGLGEISPKEFKDFIGENMRLTPVTFNPNQSMDEALTFYMGKNTQARRDYIMDSLVVPEED
jgi:DNA gyrase subunit B/topoisomerase-4 subunit B